MNFRKLFQPKTLAVIGVSLHNDRHPANVIFNKNLLRYSIKVFPVNPRGGSLQGEMVFQDISDIPGPIDLAVIAARSEQVQGILKSCIHAGVGSVIVVSGGFAEIGKCDLQERIGDMAREADLPLIGPNCLGIYCPNKIDTLFLPSERMVRPESGNVAVISQSGGILVDQIVKFADEGVGLSLALSIGNKAVVKEIDLLKYLAKDKNTSVIAFYIEGFQKREGREFVLAAHACPKPVIVLKAGKSPGGTRAVSSHTASLAGDYQVFSHILSQHGIVEAKNEFELLSFCESLSCYQSPIEGNIGIITGSGGHGALSVDVCADQDLTVPALSTALQKRIRNKLSASIKPIASTENPVDLTGSAVDDDFTVAVNALCNSAEIDCVIVLLLPYLPGVTSDLGARLSQISWRAGKPLIAYVPHIEKYRMLIEGFELNRIPVSPSIEGAVLMAEAMRRCRPC